MAHVLEPAEIIDIDQATDDAVDDRADATNRVHHHARIDDDGALVGSDRIHTLCGLRLPRPRPDAARMPCCPMCADQMGGPCR